MIVQDSLWLVTAAILIATGVFGVLVAEHLLRKILALNLLGVAIFLMMIKLGGRAGVPDPITQAMVLTGIVVAVSATAFALALMVALYRRTGQLSLDPKDASEETDEQH